MSVAATIFKELFGLFVDDGSLALVILAWVGLFALFLLVVGSGGGLAGIIFFAGLAVALVENVLRRARVGK